jgi:hypothetical protein
LQHVETRLAKVRQVPATLLAAPQNSVDFKRKRAGSRRPFPVDNVT